MWFFIKLKKTLKSNSELKTLRDKRKYDEAIRHFEVEMVKKEIHPDVVTYNLMIMIYGKKKIP